MAVQVTLQLSGISGPSLLLQREGQRLELPLADLQDLLVDLCQVQADWL